MNKYEYLAELRNNLSTLPKSEQDEAVKYYRGVFNDAGKSNEQSVVRNLGSPESLGNKLKNSEGNLTEILHETGKNAKKTVDLSDKKRKNLLLITALLFPIWGSLALAVIGAVFLMFIGFTAIFIAALILGVALICMGIVHMIETVSIGLFHIGAGFVLSGAVLLSFMPAMNFVFWIFKSLLKCGMHLLKVFIGKREVKA